MDKNFEWPRRESVWSVAGNIVEERPYGPGGSETRRGTRLFRPGAKIYLATLRNAWVYGDLNTSPPEEAIQVVGQHRKSRSWLVSWVRFRDTANWRVQVIHTPAVVSRLYAEEWPGFLLEAGAFSRAEDGPALESVRSLISVLGECDERIRFPETFEARRLFLNSLMKPEA